MSSNRPGMGPDYHGPDFARPPSGQTPSGQTPSGQTPSGQTLPGPSAPGQQPAGWPTSGGHQDPAHPSQHRQPSRPESPRPPKNRLPAIITVAVIGVVALVVVIATVYASRQDAQVVAEPQQSSAPPRPTAVPSSSDDTITFSSAEGTGQLTMESHAWSRTGAIDPEYGEYLQIELEISATEGSISHGPEYFQAFDASGDLYQTTEAGVTAEPLGSGVVHAGDKVTGEIAFDIPRGPVTLLMSNSMMESVTALRITD